MKDVQLVGAWFSGTARDIQLVSDRLTQGVYVIDRAITRNFGLFHRALRKARDVLASRLGLMPFKPKTFRLSIFFQQPTFWNIRDAYVNCVIPNQEWFSWYGEALLPQIDEVWCKTQEAVRIFSGLGKRCRYIGFTSDDRYLPEYDAHRDYRRFLHVAGPSVWKGTKVLVEAWLKHPEWPHLTVLTRTCPETLPRELPPNLSVFSHYVTETELKRLQNCCGIYIQPTEMEGFGHTLCEAMSAKSVVVTTDGAPMNELVHADQGFLIEAYRTERHFLGTRHFVAISAIERVVDLLISTDLEELERRGNQARASFLAMDAQFTDRLVAAVDELMKG